MITQKELTDQALVLFYRIKDQLIRANPGFQKTRYRGLEKNASQVNLLVGLANLYMLRRQLMAA